MKNSLSLSIALLLLAPLTPLGASAALPEPVSPTLMAAYSAPAAPEFLLTLAAPLPTAEPVSMQKRQPQVQLAAIRNDSRSLSDLRGIGTVDPTPGAARLVKSTQESGVPSTPAGLAAVALLICILVTRRNKYHAA